MTGHRLPRGHGGGSQLDQVQCLITFEVAEVAWIGFQPIEGVFALVGAAVLAFAAAWRQQ